MNPLKEILNPGSIVIYGASNNPTKMGSMQLINILETGYQGKVFVVHRREKEVLGLPAWPSAEAIPERVDLAQVVTPPQAVPGILEEIGRAGIRRAIIISGGFKEMGDEGRELEGKLREIAERHAIRFLGPNCVGIMSSPASLNTTTIARPPMGGKVALVSQSGAYSAMIYPFLAERGLRVHTTISVGNEADIDVVDCLDYLAEVDEVRAVGLYLETVRRPREFIHAARKAAERKPVTAFYVGGTEAGARASLSHTGAICGSDELYSGLFSQSGVIRVSDMDEMADALLALSLQPLPPGPRFAVITNSGGPGSALCYHLEKAGLEVPIFSRGLAERLKAMTRPLSYCGNPVDLTFETDQNLFLRILGEVLSSGEVDGAVIYGLFAPSDFMHNIKARIPAVREVEEALEKGFSDFTRSLAEIPRSLGKPLLVLSFLPPGSSTAKKLVGSGIPVYQSARRIAEVASVMVRYSQVSPGSRDRAP
jgi:acetyltransferase